MPSWRMPIVAASVTGNDSGEDHGQLVNGYGRWLVGTFSAADLRRCHIASIETWLSATAWEFIETIFAGPLHSGGIPGISSLEPVTCRNESPLLEAIEKAVRKHVHRVCVVDGQLLVGLVSLTDIISLKAVPLVRIVSSPSCSF